MAKTSETLQGSSCSYGAKYNAYLKKDAIYRAARHLGTRSLDEVIDSFVAHVPDQHVQNSCFYHTREGCTLPREMRSTTCKVHLCSAVKSLARIMSELEPETPVLVVAGSYEATYRAIAVTQSSATPVYLVSLAVGARKAS